MSDEYLQILIELINNGADAKLKNKDNWSPLEIATSYTDIESVRIIYESLLKRRKAKIKKNSDRLSNFLSLMPNFYLEMNWQVNIPGLSYFLPRDTCQLWKYGSNVRMDYTFVQFKSLKSIRRPSTIIFKTDEKTDDKIFYRVDHQNKIYFNQFEDLDSDEKKLIIQEIMNLNRMHGEFKLKECAIKESKSFWNSKKNVYENIYGWNCQQYEINVKTSVNVHKKEKHEFLDLNKDIYLDENKDLKVNVKLVMNETQVKNHFANGMKVKNDTIRSELMKLENNKDKSLKAYVWIAENYPIKSSVNILYNIYFS
jgi:hypothetical protein